MPGALQKLEMRTPGARGVVTDLEGSSSDHLWSTVLKNAVVNASNRIAARKGWALLTSSGNHGEDTNAIYEFVYNATTTYILSAANDKIYSGTTTLVDRTNPAGGLTAPTADDWQFVTMGGKCYGWQANHTPVVWDPSGGTYDASDFQDLAPSTGTAPNGNAAVASHGRIFAFDSDMQTIKWCPLLNDDDWSGAGSGSIDLDYVWPNGADTGVALVVWNDYLVVFGKRSVLVFGGLDDPNNNLALASTGVASSPGVSDTITGDGLVARDAVVSTGTDLIYLSRTGLRTLKRGLVYDQLPLTSIAPHIQLALSTDIETALDASSVIRMEYHRQLGAVVARIGSKYWYFDVRDPDAVRASRWEGIGWKCAKSIGSTLYLGQNDGVAHYSGYQDGGSSYQFEWLSSWIPVGSHRQFIPKRALLYMEAGLSQSVLLRWAWDYVGSLFTESRALDVPLASQWNGGTSRDEWGIGEWGTSGTLLVQPYDMSGIGSLVQIGVSTTIDGGEFSVQQLDVLGKFGRLHR